MISRLLLPSLFALPLCAQAPAEMHPVHFILQAEPPPVGIPALDTAALSNALQAFATAQHLERPVPGGDGWVLGVRLATRQSPEGLLIGAGTLRLSHLKGGQVESEGAKEDVAVAEARETPQLASALGRELVRRAQRLLSQVHMTPPPPPVLAGVYKAPVVSAEPDGQIMDVDFSKVGIASTSSQPSYPPEAKVNHVQGKVVLEVTVDALGVPESVTPLKGPGPLLTYAMGWAMRWRFKPLETNGKPVRARFPLFLDFRLQ